jgi:hypothetical protein
MARIYHRHPQTSAPEAQPAGRWWGGTGMAFSAVGWTLILLSNRVMGRQHLYPARYPHEDARHASHALIAGGAIVLVLALIGSIVGIRQRSLTGWVGLLMSAGVAVLLLMVGIVILTGMGLIVYAVTHSHTPGL